MKIQLYAVFEGFSGQNSANAVTVICKTISNTSIYLLVDLEHLTKLPCGTWKCVFTQMGELFIFASEFLVGNYS